MRSEADEVFAGIGIGLTAEHGSVRIVKAVVIDARPRSWALVIVVCQIEDRGRRF